MQETQGRSLGQVNPLEKGMATHSSKLAQRIPWTEEPGGPQFMGMPKSQTRLSNLADEKTETQRKWPGQGHTQPGGLESAEELRSVECWVQGCLIWHQAGGKQAGLGRFGSITEHHWSLSPCRPHTAKNQDLKSSERSQGHELWTRISYLLLHPQTQNFSEYLICQCRLNL